MQNHLIQWVFGTAVPPQPYKYTGTARAKKAPLAWSCCKMSRRWSDQGSTSAHTISNWRPAEDVGNYDQGRPGTPLRTTSLQPRTTEKGLGKSLYWAHTGPSSLECLLPRRDQLNWWGRLNSSWVNADASTSKVSTWKGSMTSANATGPLNYQTVLLKHYNT